MARESVGWIDTKTAELPTYPRTVNSKTRYQKKGHHLPPMNIHYESLRSPAEKEWTDQSLLTNRSVNNFLTESDAFQRASFANIVGKWKDHERNKTTQLISSFDSHYNMKHRFRSDDQLNRSPEVEYASGARYHRFIGNENNPKNDKPCCIHQRHIQDYDERHLRELLKLPSLTKPRSVPYFLSKRAHLPSIESAPIIMKSEFDDDSRHTFS